MTRLGVNIDHVATVRNARGEFYPSPYKAAIIAKESGANSVTVHLREDRRHISDNDLFKITKIKKIRVNLEISPTKEMLSIAMRAKPDFVCIVPEKRKELTTEGGLNLKKNYLQIKKIVTSLKKSGISTSLFIEPNLRDIDLSTKIGTKSVELHTGKFCNLYNSKKKFMKEFSRIKKCSYYAKVKGLEVHAGHGLTYKSAKKILKIKEIEELNIGHFIISEAIFIGLKKAILNFKKILK